MEGGYRGEGGGMGWRGTRACMCYTPVSYTHVCHTHTHTEPQQTPTLITCPVEHRPIEYFQDPTSVLSGISGVERPVQSEATAADSSAMMLICWPVESVGRSVRERFQNGLAAARQRSSKTQAAGRW